MKSLVSSSGIQNVENTLFRSNFNENFAKLADFWVENWIPIMKVNDDQNHHESASMKIQLSVSNPNSNTSLITKDGDKDYKLSLFIYHFHSFIDSLLAELVGYFYKVVLV